jgi:hypothetical protein
MQATDEGADDCGCWGAGKPEAAASALQDAPVSLKSILVTVLLWEVECDGFVRVITSVYVRTVSMGL